jgi:hypothetical protein
VHDVLAGFGTSSGLTVTDVTPTGPGTMGGAAKCGRARASNLPVAPCVWGDHGSVGVVVGFSRTTPDTADLLRTIRPLVVHR